MTFAQETEVQVLFDTSHHESLPETSHMGFAFKLYQMDVDLVHQDKT